MLNAASAALSCLVLFAGLRKLDLNREASKKALEHKKEIAKHLDRPLIQTNPYEVCVKVSVFFAIFFLGFFLFFLFLKDSVNLGYGGN